EIAEGHSGAWALCRYPAGDRLRMLAAVEPFRAMAGDVLERLAKLRIAHSRPHGERLAFAIVEQRAPLRIGSGAVRRPFEEFAEPLGDDETVASQSDGRSKQVGPGECAMRSMGFSREADVGRNADAKARQHGVHKRQRTAVLAQEPI